MSNDLSDWDYCKLHRTEYRVDTGRLDLDCPQHIAEAVVREERHREFERFKTLVNQEVDKVKRSEKRSSYLVGFAAGNVFLVTVYVAVYLLCAFLGR